MKLKKHVKISTISWLTTLDGNGYVEQYYEPECINELEELCRNLYREGVEFDLIGHTSNTLYAPDYLCQIMVSTRKLNHYEIKKECIVCECGVSVRALSIAAIEAGIKGFEGLIDLPGTVGAALYGNAGCFGCSISSLLKECTLITSDGEVITVGPEWFVYSNRSSVLKRKEKKAVILSVLLYRDNGLASELKRIADNNHANRRSIQPDAKNSLGSIFSNSGEPSLLYRFLSMFTKPYAIILRLVGYDNKKIEDKRKHLFFVILGARDIEPYVRTWNWYQWIDKDAHVKFWKFVRLHRLLFTKSDFEIEIKDNMTSC